MSSNKDFRAAPLESDLRPDGAYFAPLNSGSGFSRFCSHAAYTLSRGNCGLAEPVRTFSEWPRARY